MLTMKRYLIILYAVVAALASSVASGAESADRILNVNVHLIAGLSNTTNNYVKCFPEISDLNSSVGQSLGVGVDGVMMLGRRWGIGTAINFIHTSRRMDMAVSGFSAKSVSNVFQRNSYYVIDVPIYARWHTRIASEVRWNIDGGIYYSYGTGGKQKNTIYDAKINDLGQLFTTRTELEAGYYNDGNAFVNSYRRADVGLHIATGLTFKRHITVGLRAHLGLKDVSRNTGIVNPSARNVDLMALLGWTF